MLTREFKGDFEAMRHADKDALVAVDGIGDVLADSFIGYFADGENVRRVDHLLEELVIEKEDWSGGNGALEGKTFVITGSLEHFSNRKELQAKIEELGGRVTGSVTAKTSYLINNDVTSSSSKNKKARELGIGILSEEDFLKMIQA